MSSPPPIKKPSEKGFRHRINYDNASIAIETVKNILAYIVVGSPLIRGGPGGETHVDVPLMYQNFALDRIHYDPYIKMPSPKGRPVRAVGVSVDEGEVREILQSILRDIQVVDAVEYREPEDAWIIPIAWNHLIIAQIKVSYDGKEIIPDYGLTEKVKKHVI